MRIPRTRLSSRLPCFVHGLLAAHAPNQKVEDENDDEDEDDWGRKEAGKKSDHGRHAQVTSSLQCQQRKHAAGPTLLHPV